MTFENLCKIVDGKRRNFPDIGSYEKIETKAYLIKQGDLFVGDESTEIALAIQNGAYGVLYSQPETIMIDSEVAWIEVASLKDALIHLLRFLLIKSSAHFDYFPSIQKEILAHIADKKSLLFLEANPLEDFRKIIHAQNDAHFICDDLDYLKAIFPDFHTYHDKHVNALSPQHHTLFLSSFIYKDQHYHDIRLPRLFLPQLTHALYYLETFDIPYQLERLHFLHSFHPFFITHDAKPCHFGQSHKVMIVEERQEQIQADIDYIKKDAKWANLLIILPQNSPIKQQDEDLFYYQTLEDIFDAPLDKYHFILIHTPYQALYDLLYHDTKSPSPSLLT